MDDAGQEKEQRAYWNDRAADYPRFEEGDNTYEARMLRRVREQGVDFSGKSVLDVGCGSGMYTLRIAALAARVTALDLSDEMLRILRQDAGAQGIANIDYVRSGWLEYEPAQVHDIAFCSMTPAIRDNESREKLLKSARERVVFLAFARRPPSDVMQGLYRHYHVAPKRFESAPQMRAWLDEQGIEYVCRSVEEQWDEPWLPAAILRKCVLALERHGVNPDPAFLAAHIDRFKDDQGRIREKTGFTAEIITWKGVA